MPELCLNIIPFEHPDEQVCLYFSKESAPGLTGVSKEWIPKRVIEHYGRQDRYFVCCKKRYPNMLPLNMCSHPDLIESSDKNRKESRELCYENCFSIPLLRLYYTDMLQRYIHRQGIISGPAMAGRLQLYQNAYQTQDFSYYERYSIKPVIMQVSGGPALLFRYKGRIAVLKKTLDEIYSGIPPSCFQWLLAGRKIRKSADNKTIKCPVQQIYPVCNPELNKALKIYPELPEEIYSQRIQYEKLSRFIEQKMHQKLFHDVLNIQQYELLSLGEKHTHRVKTKIRKYRYKNHLRQRIPTTGLNQNDSALYPPWPGCAYFFVYHEGQQTAVEKLDNYLSGKTEELNGMQLLSGLPYYHNTELDIVFSNKDNPLKEIRIEMDAMSFAQKNCLMAICLSELNTKTDSINCFRIKELLMKRGIATQHINLADIKPSTYNKMVKPMYRFMLDKAGTHHCPGNINHTNELLIGISSYAHHDIQKHYLGCAADLQCDGNFRYFDCFRDTQLQELSGFITHIISNCQRQNGLMKRVVIHYYNNQCRLELPKIIESRHWNIPIYLVILSKPGLSGLSAFDISKQNKVPADGSYVQIEKNSFLLFSHRHKNRTHCTANECSLKLNLLKLYKQNQSIPGKKTCNKLVEQVYSLSRLRPSPGPLPVSVQYPASIAAIYPYLESNDILHIGPCLL